MGAAGGALVVREVDIGQARGGARGIIPWPSGGGGLELKHEFTPIVR
jgi:hypothetical protein